MTDSRPRWPLLAITLLLTSCTSTAAVETETPRVDIAAEIAGVETRNDAIVGIYALDTATGTEVEYRSDERFAYASTIKALAAAAVLHRPDTDVDELVTYTADDLVDYSPVTQQHVDTGMTLNAVIDAAIRDSDNTAGNLLLRELGGPEALRADLRAIGDDTTEPARWEPELNEFTPGDDRDTSTAAALGTSLLRYASEVLDEDARARLVSAMLGTRTGDDLIRAAVPDTWRVADKTGTGGHGTRNDIALLWPSEGADPVVLAVLTRSVAPDGEPSDALVAESAGVALAALGW